GRRGPEMNHGPGKRALISFDYPRSARHIPLFGHRVPKTSALGHQHGAALGLVSETLRHARHGARSNSRSVSRQTTKDAVVGLRVDVRPWSSRCRPRRVGSWRGGDSNFERTWSRSTRKAA